MSLKIKKTVTANLDEGVYKAVVASIEEKQGGQDGKSYLQWKFLVKNPMHDGELIEGKVNISSNCSMNLSPKSKLWGWAIGCGLDVRNAEINLEDAINKVVRITVEDHEDKDGQTWSRVTKIRSLSGKSEVAEDDEQPKAKAVKKQASDDDDDAPLPKKAKKVVEEEEEEDEEEDEEEAPPAKKKAKKVVEEEEEEDEEEEEEDTPPPAKKKAKKVVEEEEEEEDEEEEDEDDAPPPPAKKKAKKVEEDEEEDAPPAKKKKAKDDDEDDLFDFDSEE